MVRFGAAVAVVLLAGTAGAEETGKGMYQKADKASPAPAQSPGATTKSDPASGAPEVGIGRSTGAVKSSGDEGGTAAGMPGKGPESR
jgi:hypothetical protein